MALPLPKPTWKLLEAPTLRIAKVGPVCILSAPKYVLFAYLGPSGMEAGN